MPEYMSLGSRGGVSSQIHLATVEGLRILESGGNAFDAAIMVSSMLTVLLPHTSGVGGDGFLLALDTGGELIAYNGSGRSPRKLPVDEFLASRPTRGPLTVTVPGLVDLWEKVNEDYGSMELSRLLMRAISLARNGFYVQEPLARAIDANESVLARYESWRRVFGGLEAGSEVRFPSLARLYAAIAKKGADAFYRSKLTEGIVDELSRYGVPLTYEDLAEHRGEKIDPIGCAYRDYDLYELPPNSQGLSTLQLLKAIELAELHRLSFESPERVKELLRLSAVVYDDRDRHVADPAHYKAPVEDLLSPSHLRRKMEGSRTTGRLGPNDTTFFVVADRYGNLVGFIQSIFQSFGSGIVTHDVPFQCRGAGFADISGLPNSPAGRKRPLHTLSILLARHSAQGDYMIGCAGGDFRPQIHAEVLANAADYKMTLSEAVEAPRCILTYWRDGQMKGCVEEGLWASELPGWIDRVGYQSPNTGIVHAARKRRNGVFEFVADPRGGGVATPLL